MSEGKELEVLVDPIGRALEIEGRGWFPSGNLKGNNDSDK